MSESLPNITGLWRMDYGRPTATVNGAFYDAGGGAEIRGSTHAGNCGLGFNASLSSSTYQNNAPVQQNALCVNMIIKY